MRIKVYLECVWLCILSIKTPDPLSVQEIMSGLHTYSFLPRLSVSFCYTVVSYTPLFLSQMIIYTNFNANEFSYLLMVLDSSVIPIYGYLTKLHSRLYLLSL